MRRYKFFVLFIILTSCSKSPSVKRLQAITGDLIKSEEIDYPSGSSLNLFKDSLYLMGDDARELVILDTAFEIHRSIVLFPGNSRRQRKWFKSDIECGELLSSKNKTELFLFGSGSVSPYRDTLFKVDLQQNQIDKVSLFPLYRKLNKSRILEINIEGATFVKEHLLLANRGNLDHKQNYIVAVKNFVPMNINSVKLIPLNLPDSSLGVSGLDYYKKKDLLFITLSSEATASASTDGKIGNSSLAIIRNLSKKLNADSLSVDALVSLPDIDKIFCQKKIESVAVGSKLRQGLILYLVADNDDGKSILYKVKLKF